MDQDTGEQYVATNSQSTNQVNAYETAIMHADLLKQFGKALMRARVELGLNKSQLAARLGVTIRTITRWERGEALPASYYLDLIDQDESLSAPWLSKLTLPPRGKTDSSSSRIRNRHARVKAPSKGTDAPKPASTPPGATVDPLQGTEPPRHPAPPISAKHLYCKQHDVPSVEFFKASLRIVHTIDTEFPAQESRHIFMRHVLALLTIAEKERASMANVIDVVQVLLSATTETPS